MWYMFKPLDGFVDTPASKKENQFDQLLEGDCGALQLPEIACGNGRVSRVLCQCSYARFINVSKGVLVGAQHNV